MGVRHLQGTPWHVEKIGREEGDPRRDKRKCKYYRKGEYNTCEYNIDACKGSAHCGNYVERKLDDELSDEISKSLVGSKDNNKPVTPDNLAKDMYPIDADVIHDKYGKGVVKSIENNRLIVDFDDYGEKVFNVDICVKNRLITRVR